jgi:glycosyltransferase involved in cell wall biosynthesis
MNWAVTFEEDLALARSPAVAPWVEFVTPLDYDRRLESYREADIFVFPSLVESFGHPMAEAMAAGLPVVAADTPVNREICDDAAVYFSSLNPVDLAQQVRRLAADSALRSRLGAAGRERVTASFRWEEHVRRLLEKVGALPTDAVESGRGASTPGRLVPLPRQDARPVAELEARPKR